jgi:DNA-binding IscR family transcriptional regulator
MLDLPWMTVRGLHALKALAREGGPMSTGAIAREACVPPGRAASLLRILRSADLVEEAGPRRWALARRPEQISVLEAVEALGASRPRAEHCQADWSICDNRGGCAIAPLCREAHRRLLEIFRGHTLADLRVEMPSMF